ncbi:LuxR C-terminal-related transcriptional regulator [Cereibacter sp. SYSU M97828]|nr:LuxR C-terminal-related transcriptional regulator [Cereibacter flavus]
MKEQVTPDTDEDIRTRIIIANANPAFRNDMRQIIELLHPEAEVIVIAPPPEQTAGPEAALERLSGRQRDVLELLVEGHTNKTIARRLSISPSTVRVHVSALLRALGVRTRTAAAAFAMARKFQPRRAAVRTYP